MKWKPIPDYPDYLISENGEVRRSRDCATTRAGYVLKPAFKRGYWQVTLSFNAKMRIFPVHRLVCRTFNGPQPTPNHIVAHGDGNPQNNHYTNLRWATHKENQYDRTRHGRRKWGEQSHFHKLTDAAVMDIRTRFLYGDKSITKLAEIYGVSRGQISNIVNKKQQNGPTLIDADKWLN